MRKTRLLIDGDLLTFAAVSAHLEDFEWAEGVWCCFVRMFDAQEKFKADLQRLIDTFGEADGGRPDLVMFCMTGANNFRKEILSTYKGNRGRKPPGYAVFQEWVEDYLGEMGGIEVYRREGLEADDCLGILGTHQTKTWRSVIWSKDKDLRMVPCEHYDLDNRVVEDCEPGWETRHPLQTLTGDSTDGYKGLPGCGAVKAKKIITQGPPEEVWCRVEEAFVKAGLTREDMLVQARVARILQADDYDFKAGKPKVWNPPKGQEATNGE